MKELDLSVFAMRAAREVEMKPEAPIRGVNSHWGSDYGLHRGYPVAISRRPSLAMRMKFFAALAEVIKRIIQVFDDVLFFDWRQILV